MSKENPRYVGRYRTYESANAVVPGFVREKAQHLYEPGNPFFNGHCLNAVLEFTKKGNKRFVFRVFVKKTPDEYTKEDLARIKKVGRTYRGLPIQYCH